MNMIRTGSSGSSSTATTIVRSLLSRPPAFCCRRSGMAAAAAQALMMQTQRQGLSVPVTVQKSHFSTVSVESSSGGGGEGGGSTGGTSVAFDRTVKTLQRDRAARNHKVWNNNNKSGAVDYDYFREEIAMRLVDRLDDIKRDEGFPLALDIGSGSGYIYKAICADDAIDGEGGIGGVRKLVQLDSSKEMLYRDEDISVDGSERCDTYRMVANEEDKLPFPDGTFDLVLSSTALHWINDLPSLFTEVNRVLKPDGCFIFAMVGGSSLSELRISMLLAELERDGGVSPHVGPFVELNDVGSLLQRSKFALPTIDTDTIRVAYPNAFVLMEHLQRMGENNACIHRRKDSNTSRDTLLATACIYDEMFAMNDQDTGDDNSSSSEIEASVQVIFAIGWTPHGSQPKPDERGSATHKFGDIPEEVH